MLILVGVTINVALNGGLFEKAKNASDQTQRESDREQLISAAMACIGTDGKVVLTGANGLDSNLPEEFKLVSSGIYENKKTGKQYKVDQTTGNVTEYTQDDLTPAGTYTTSAAGQSISGVSSITLNDDGTTGSMIMGGTPMPIEYTYTANTVTIIMGENSTPPCNYEVINNNIILFIGEAIFATDINALMHYAIYEGKDEETYFDYAMVVDNILYTEDGQFEDFETATMPLNGRTYIGDSGDGGNMKVVFGETIVNGIKYGTITHYVFENDSWRYESDDYYCVVGSTLYFVNKEEFRAGESVTINEGYTLITLENGNGYFEYQAP